MRGSTWDFAVTAGAAAATETTYEVDAVVRDPREDFEEEDCPEEEQELHTELLVEDPLESGKYHEGEIHLIVCFRFRISDISRIGTECRYGHHQKTVGHRGPHALV